MDRKPGFYLILAIKSRLTWRSHDFSYYVRSTGHIMSDRVAAIKRASF
ncbi:hypothetical protein QUA43_18160 [Microcoleus sp. N9_B4]